MDYSGSRGQVNQVMLGSVFFSWKKDTLWSFLRVKYSLQRTALWATHWPLSHVWARGLTRYCNKHNSLSLCSDLNWVLMVPTFLSLFPTPSIRWKPQAHYLSVSLTDSSVLSLYSGTVSFKSMHTLPTNARCPNLSVEHTEKESEDVFLFWHFFWGV